MKGIKLQPFTAHGRTVEIYYVPIPDEEGAVTRGIAVKEKGLYRIFINSAISLILQKHTLGSMEKPSTILVHELQERIVQAVNTAGLPPFVVAFVLRQTLAEIEAIERQQYIADKQAYEEAQKNADRKPVN